MYDQEKYGLISNMISFYSIFEKEVLDLVSGNNNSILSPLLFKALHSIYLDNAILPSVLSKRLSITTANTSRSIRKLTDLGYISKTKDKNDKRIIHLSLTSKGIDLVDTSLKALEVTLSNKFAVLDSKELNQLSDAFSISRDLLIKIADIHNN